MFEILITGFLIGMRHAIEADHLAAIASIVTNERVLNKKRALWHGISWGLGHTITLAIICMSFMLLGQYIPENIAAILEMLVGIMLVLLGMHVIYGLLRERIHFHRHQHTDGRAHFHAHSHKQSKVSHKIDPHHHKHHLSIRPLAIGLMHGVAGSAILLVLLIESFTSVWSGFIYILIFGLGSVVGMGILSLIISMPIRASRKLTYFYSSLTSIVGIFTIGLGAFTIANYFA